MKKDWNKHVDRIIEIADSIEPGKLTILTGSNGSGKSVIRKLLPTRIQEKLGKDSPEQEHSAEIWPMCMQVRSAHTGNAYESHRGRWIFLPWLRQIQDDSEYSESQYQLWFFFHSFLSRLRI